MTLGTSGYQTVDGVRVHYVSAGSGPSLVLIHGYLVSQHCFSLVLSTLAERFAVLAVDLPGHGESDRPAHYPYTIEAFSHTVAGLLDALGIGKTAVLGHSMGGAVAAALAVANPERVSHLVGVDPYLLPIPFPLEGKVAMLPVLGELLFTKLYRKSDLYRYFRRDVYLDPALPTEETMQFYWERFNRPGGRQALYRTLQTLARMEAVEDLAARIVCPTFFVWGAEDKLVPPAHAGRLRPLLRGHLRGVVIIPGSGHSPQEERPGPFCEAVLSFLESAP